MSVLTKDDLLNMVKEKIGEDTSDESITFIENINDTLDDLITKAKGDGIDWKSKFEENDAHWRETYKERFFNNSTPASEPITEVEETPKKLTFESLFN